MLRPLITAAALILVAAGCLPAATITWNGLNVTTLDINNVAIPLTSIPITEIDGVWYVTVRGELIKLPLIFFGGIQLPGTTVSNGTMLIRLANNTEVELPTLTFQGVQIPSLPLGDGFVPLVVLRTLDKDIQAKSVDLLLDRWIDLYGLLETPTLYKGNRFAVMALAIKAQAQKEGVSDSILAKCATFAADLKRLTKTL